MISIPRSRHGTRLLAGAVWLAACALLWWVQPVVPRVVVQVDPQTRTFDFTPDGAELVTFGWDSSVSRELSIRGQFHRWNCASGTQVGESIETSRFAFPKRVSPDRRWWFLESVERSDRRIQLLDVANWRIDTLPIVGAEYSYAVAFAPDSRLLMVECESGDESGLAVWNLEKRELEAMLPSLQLPAACSADGRLLAATVYHPKGGATVRIFGRPGLRPVGALHAGPQECFDFIAFSQDGSTAVALLEERDVEETGEFVSLGGRLSTLHRTFRCWDVDSGEERFTLSYVYGEPVFADRDRTIVAVQHDHEGQSIRWYDAVTGRLRNVRRFAEDSVGLARDSLSFDSSIVAIRVHESDFLTALADRFNVTLPFNDGVSRAGIRLYDAATGRRLADVRAYSPCWSPNGRALATLLDNKFNGRIGLYDIPPRRSLTWFVAGAGVLALPIAILARWRIRRLRAADIR